MNAHMGNLGLLIIIAVLLWSSPFTVAENTAEIDVGAEESKSSDLNAAQALELLSAENDVIVLDVRTPQEFSAGHIKGAVNINILEDSFKEKMAKLGKDRAYLVHCAAGAPTGRSRRSVTLMEEVGFKKIYHLDGGFISWQQAGNPVSTGEEKE